MITYLRTSLFDSPAQTLVNTVNTVGVMGKGIAKEFKERYPKMFAAYKKLCAEGELDIGRLHLWRDADHWVLNFPTKTTWRKPSELDYIERGLETFVSTYQHMGISSIAFPPLGCGNGNLNWTDVKPIMERHLQGLPISVYIHDRQVDVGFVAEHNEPGVAQAPSSFDEFVADLRDNLSRDENAFRTLIGRHEFAAEWLGEGEILVRRKSDSHHIPSEYLEWAWSTLQSGVLTSRANEGPGKTQDYLLAILAKLPYVRVVEVSKPEWLDTRTAYGLYFGRAALVENAAQAAEVTDKNQLCLFPDS